MNSWTTAPLEHSPLQKALDLEPSAAIQSSHIQVTSFTPFVRIRQGMAGLLKCLTKRCSAEASGDASEPDAAALVLKAERHSVYEAVAVETFKEGVEEHNLVRAVEC